MGDDLGVGFGDELVAFGDEGVFEGEVVFDDAVVDDDESAGAVAVGVGVFFGGAAMGGPAGVANAEGAVEGGVGDDGFAGCDRQIGAEGLPPVGSDRLPGAARAGTAGVEALGLAAPTELFLLLPERATPSPNGMVSPTATQSGKVRLMKRRSRSASRSVA